MTIPAATPWRRSSILMLLAWAAIALGPPASFAQNDAGPEREWRFIEKLKDDGMSDVAARQLELFAQAYPDDRRSPGALFEAGQTWEKLDQVVAALGAYDRLLAGFPASDEAPVALLRKGDLLSGIERFSEAANVYRGLLSSYPASAGVDSARLGLGEALMAQQQNEEASRLFRYLLNGLTPAPVAARAKYDLGLLHRQAGADSLAVVEFDSIVERYPNQIVGALGLLRSAEILTEREAFGAARERYERVGDAYDEQFLRARADLGLARLDERQGDLAGAADRLRRVVDKGGTPEQLESALLDLARLQLERKKYNDAADAADAYLTEFPDGRQAPRAQVIAAAAALGRGDANAADRLSELGDTTSREIAHDALLYLAIWHRDAGRVEDAIESYRRVGRVASSSADVCDALLAEAALMHQSGRHPLAADLASQAFHIGEDPATRSRSLLAEVQYRDAAGDAEAAAEVATRLTVEFPLRAEATEARVLLNRLKRSLARDPVAAAHQLAELAADDAPTPVARNLRVGRVLRETLGDGVAALEYFAAARSHASTPVEKALVSYELGRTWEDLAAEHSLEGDDSDADDALKKARSHYADGASEAGAGEASRRARMGLVRLETALAAVPNAPWRFDARRDPLVGGTREAEAVDLDSDPFRKLLERVVATLEAGAEGDDAAWLWWRRAELSIRADLEQRLAALETGLGHASTPEQEMVLRYGIGQLLLQAKRGDEAAAQLRRVVEGEPTTDLGIAARYGLAEAHRAAKRYGQAGTLYAEFAGAYPQSRKGQRAMLLAGDCALYAGDEATSIARYRQLLESYPGSVYEDDAQYRLGTALQRAGRGEAARESFTRLVQWQGGSDYRGRSLLKLAQLDAKAGRDSLAVESYERLRATDPELASTSNVDLELARLYLDGNQSQRALAALDRLPNDDPSAQALALRIEALAQLGKIEQAEVVLERLSRGYPEAADAATTARIEVAERVDEGGDHERARGMFQVAIAEATDRHLRARARFGEGLALARAGKFDEAYPVFEAAAEDGDGGEWGAQALFKVGGIASRSENPGRAREAFSRIVEEYPDHELAPESLRGLALAWRQANRFDRALEAYHSLLERYADRTDGADVLNNIAYCHHEMGQYDVAISAYERVLPMLDEEGQGYAQFWIADSLEQMGRLDDAAAAFLRIPYLYPSLGQLPVTAQLKAAGVYEKMGNAPAAVRLYEKVIADHGRGSQWGDEAVERMDRLNRRTNGES